MLPTLFLFDKLSTLDSGGAISESPGFDVRTDGTDGILKGAEEAGADDTFDGSVALVRHGGLPLGTLRVDVAVFAVRAEGVGLADLGAERGVADLVCAGLGCFLAFAAAGALEGV